MKPIGEAGRQEYADTSVFLLPCFLIFEAFIDLHAV